MTAPTKRIVLFGCGLWGVNILRDLLSLGCRVVVVEPDPESAHRALTMGAESIHPIAEPLPAFDGAVIATPASTHVHIIEPLLELGIPIFCEKPLTTDLKTMRRLANRAEGVLFEMHVWRYHPGVEKLAQVAQEELLGPVEWLKSVRTNWTSPRKDVDPIWTLAPHDLSIALEVLGTIPRPVAAMAEQTAGRLTGLVALLADERLRLQFEVSTRYAEKRRDIRLHCAEGIAVLEHDRAEQIVLRRDRGDGSFTTEKLPITQESPLLRELRTFLSFLDGGPAPRSGVRDGLAVVESMTLLRRMAGIV
ncbi:MAG: Gfo/Idh/MocA family oxidoreductase [Magnetococcales bacterium]|nr:Gfo/Idh/MocA family oxidoreductase [Magnetococcales bacterium]